MNRFEIKRAMRISQIEEAALHLFAHHGFEKTSIRMIAQEAKISLGLLYNYYPSKEDLLLGIVRRGIQQMQAMLLPEEPLLKEPNTAQIIHLFLKHVKQNTLFWQVWHATRPHWPVNAADGTQFQIVFDLLQKKINENLLHQNIPFPGLETKLIMAALEGLIGQYLISDQYPLDDVANLLMMKYKA